MFLVLVRRMQFYFYIGYISLYFGIANVLRCFRFAFSSFQISIHFFMERERESAREIKREQERAREREGEREREK